MDSTAPTLTQACQAIVIFRDAGRDINELTDITPNGPNAQCHYTVYPYKDPTYSSCASGYTGSPSVESGCIPWETYEGFGGGSASGSGGPSGAGFSSGAGPGGPAGGGAGGPGGGGDEKGGGQCQGGNDAPQADPINPAIGNQFLTATDYRSAGSNTLSYKRYYNSKSFVSHYMGYGWRPSFSQVLGISSTRVDAYRPDGAIYVYAPSGGNWVPNSGFSGSDLTVRLVQTAGGWELILNSDTVEHYDSAGRLTSIVRKNGYTQTIGRNANGWVSSVTDSNGRSLAIGYYLGTPRVKTVTDPDGRVFEYEYKGINSYATDPNVLTRVVQPDGDDIPFGVKDAPLGVNDVLYTHLDGPDGSTSATDESAGAHPLSFAGTAQIDTAQSRYGGASALFNDVNTAYISIPDSDDWHFGAGEFTAEGWIQFASTSAYRSLFRQWGASGQHSWILDWVETGHLRFIYSTDGVSAASVTFPWTPATGVWYHIAVDRDSSNNLRLYVNDNVVASAVVTASIFNSPAVLYIGKSHIGWIDNARITKGEARYADAWASRANNPYVTYHYEDSRYGAALTGVTDEERRAGRDLVL